MPGKGRATLVALVIAFVSAGACPRASWADSYASKNAAGPGAKSVYDINTLHDSIILGAVTVLAAYPYLNGYNFIYIQPHPIAENLVPWDQKAVYNRNLFQDTLSDVTVVMSIAAPVVVDYFDVGWNRTYFEDMMVFAQTLMINSAVSAGLKYTSQRPIPRVYAGDPELVDSHRGYEGFYSGHVSTTLAALTAAAITLDLRHDLGWWPYALAAGIAATVAVERVNAGEHFPTQVVASFFVGPLIGFTVPWLHHQVKVVKQQKERIQELTVAPAETGAQLQWRMKF